MKGIKKLFKFIIGLAVTLVVVALLLVLTLPLWIGPVAKTAANRTVPGITGTDFRLGRFEFNFYTGKLCVGEIKLSNPEGYRPDDALALGLFNVDLDVGSLFEDTIIVHEIALRNVFVSYVKKDGKYNFDVIADNVAKATGGETAERQEPAEPREPGEIEIERPQPRGEGRPTEEGGSEMSQKKVIIDKIEISGITVQWGPVPLPVPPLTLRDIGRESGGVSWDVAWHQIFEQVMNKIGSVGQGLVNLGEAGLGAATNGMNVVSGVLVESSSALSGAATDSMDTITSVTTNTMDTITSTLKDGTGSTIETTSEILKATGDTAVDTLKATGDTLKAAGKDIKNMFRNKK